MRVSEIADRYASALYEVAGESKAKDQTLADIRAIYEIFEKDAELKAWLENAAIPAEARRQVMGVALKGQSVSEPVRNVISLLIDKDRFHRLGEVVEAYSKRLDEEKGVSRGMVRSAVSLGANERQRIAEMVERVVNKSVVLSYKTDPSLIGGLVAQVGSFTFDDSIESHLRRMKEELKRRVH